MPEFFLAGIAIISYRNLYYVLADMARDATTTIHSTVLVNNLIRNNPTTEEATLLSQSP